MLRVISVMTSTKCRVLRVGSWTEDLVLAIDVQLPRFAFLEKISFYSLAMHGITLPDHWMIGPQHGINVLWQELIDFGGTVSPDKRHLARDLVGVNNYFF